MPDFAFIRLETGRYLCGRGPFQRRAEAPPEGTTAFYRNGFDLDDEAPWLVPSEIFETDRLGDLLPDNGSTPLPEIAWSGLGGTDLRGVFDDIIDQIEEGSLKKSVPVLTERGILHRGEPAALVHAIGGIPDNLWGYGHCEGGQGLVGATPEQLFRYEDGVVESMALAGTAPRHEAETFLTDPKEIREHEIVADYLAEILAEVGPVQRSEREVLDLGSIVHFLTRLRVDFGKARPDFDDLIRRMHPTPALGAFPRGDGALRRLLEYRERLRVPSEFGAPFGVWHQGRLSILVAIRCVLWDGRDVFLPSGVGIVEGSRFDREWRELALKRNSVKSLLGI
ncbi:MAG: chorismate-binding protein [Verrucomicrobiota bacterium]